MNKKFQLAILVGLLFGILITLVILAIVKEEGLFSSHWWYIIYSFILLGCIIVWFFVWYFKQRKKEEKPKEKKAEPIKKSVIGYQEIVNNYWKHPQHANPDMLKVEDETAIPFPSEEDARMMILPAKKVNLGTKMLLAIGTKSQKVEASMLGTDIPNFKLQLKPKLEATTERTEEDLLSGKKISTKVVKPIIEKQVKERLEKEKKAEEEKEKVETMQSSKEEKK